MTAMTRYERSYGDKYAATSGLDIAAIAKLVRAEIKAAVASGDLPKATYSVRISRYSGGQSMDVRVSGLPFSLVNLERFYVEEGRVEEFRGVHYLSDAARDVESKLEAMVGAYNYNGSDSMTDYFDVRFYGHVEIEGYSEDAAGYQARLLECAKPRYRIAESAPANDYRPASTEDEPMHFFGS